MSTVELKNIAQDFLNNADERLLKLFVAIGKEYNSEGYSYLNNKKISSSDLAERISLSEKQIENGEVISISALEDEMKTW
jgi:hypothetical protein